MPGYFKGDLPKQRGWFHHAFVLREGEVFAVYVNGVLEVESSKVKTGENFTAGSGAMVIGRRYVDADRNYSSVVVDELLLWNRELTQQEIMKISV